VRDVASERNSCLKRIKAAGPAPVAFCLGSIRLWDTTSRLTASAPDGYHLIAV